MPKILRYPNLMLTFGALVLLALGSTLSFAQESGSSEPASAPEPLACEVTLEALWALVSDACATGPLGYVCNGGSAPQARPSGAVANSLSAVGALVETGVVEAVQTLPIITEVTGGGVMWFRWADPQYVTGLIIGEALLVDVSAADFPRWTSLVVQTGIDRPDCPTTPHNTFVLEAQPSIRSEIIVNGVSLDITGAIAIRTIENDTVFVALSGRNTATVQGFTVPLWTGQQITVRYPPGNFAQPAELVQETAPLDLALIEHLPTGLLDQPVWLPLPGYATTEGVVNLRVAPSLNAGLVGQVPANELLTILGEDPTGAWFHVSLESGITGWMFKDLLNVNDVLVSEGDRYETTPAPPQRFGTLNTIAQVRAPAGLNVRTAPSVQFDALMVLPNGAQVNMVARSPYSPWVKVTDDAGTELGWVAVIALDTRANVNALPVDNNVPPPPAPPEPTSPPVSFGNAFPDPNLPSY